MSDIKLNLSPKYILNIEAEKKETVEFSQDVFMSTFFSGKMSPMSLKLACMTF